MTTHRFLCATLAIALALGYGPAMSQAPQCQIVNPKFLTASMGSDELCDRFMTQLAQTTGNQRNLSQLTIVVEVTKEGGLHANLTEPHESEGTTEERVLPRISVEVMDRDLAVGDLDKLAQTVCQFLMQEGN